VADTSVNADNREDDEYGESFEESGGNENTGAGEFYQLDGVDERGSVGAPTAPAETTTKP